nr:hypothetical protein [Mesorhizobium sp.]
MALPALLLVDAAGLSLVGFLGHTVVRRHREAIAARIALGRVLLWVQVRSLDHAAREIQVLNGHRAEYVHVPARAEQSVEIGTLSPDVAKGVDMIRKEPMDCVFHTYDVQPAHFTWTVKAYGLKIGDLKDGIFVLGAAISLAELIRRSRGSLSGLRERRASTSRRACFQSPCEMQV